MSEAGGYYANAIAASRERSWTGREVAEYRRCPSCKRGAALSVPRRSEEGLLRVCRYCGHETGIVYGKIVGSIHG